MPLVETPESVRVAGERETWWESAIRGFVEKGTSEASHGFRKQLIKFENKLKYADLFDHYAKSLTGGD